MQYYLKCDIVNNEYLAIVNQGVFPMEIKPIIYSIISALITATIIFAVQNFWTEQEEIVRLDLIEGKQDLQATQIAELKEGQAELKAELKAEINEVKAEYKESHAELRDEFKESHAELLNEISKLVDVVQGNNDRLDSTNSRVDETNSRIDNINSNVAKVDTP